jgi:hypothetical protein
VGWGRACQSSQECGFSPKMWDGNSGSKNVGHLPCSWHDHTVVQVACGAVPAEGPLQLS